ncbi:RNA-directed DNA polymerase [Telluribacter humicola]|uniref:RNA-directed DNA polymerase n=1 Tax=Telluribacter humicola TaxID=1720261 RepID=UPI001A974313|nr:RNA-directed DNA polymerase [Telluribacter humicola]
MQNNRPETLAIRTVNQYRRRDVISYLSVRYYVESLAARTDHWANNAAIDLVLTRKSSSYFKTYHFKEIDENGEIQYREIYLPSANEALAEAALLNECSKYSEFSNDSTCVFSYNLVRNLDRTGSFKQYIVGLRERQNAITKACEDNKDGIVRHTDIKQFYPSVSLELASRIWQRTCDDAEIDTKFRLLGQELISGYGTVNENNALIVGPAFCHFIANLVLKELDIHFSNKLPAKYFRYVDDITLVGNKTSVDNSIKAIKEKLGSIGLLLHDDTSPKNIQGSTLEWLSYRHDFHESHRPISWKTLIGDLRRFLLLYPDKKEDLKHALQNEGFRIPLYDYMATTKERTFLETLLNLVTDIRFRIRARGISIQSLIRQCRFLRNCYKNEVDDLLKTLNDEHGFDRKSKITKIRYRASRLIYLASEQDLHNLAVSLYLIPELKFHATVLESIRSKNIDKVISLGTNCAQAAAQAFKACSSTVFLTLQELTPVQEQSLAIFQLYAIPVEGGQVPTCDLFEFATLGCNNYLMTCEDSFIKEISCLHGVQETIRHSV